MRKIPAIETLRRSVALLASDWRIAAKIGLPWLLIVVGLDLATTAFLFNVRPPITSGTNIVAYVRTGQALFLLATAISILAASSIAVSWHRHLLAGDHSGKSTILRIDALVWRYAGNGVLALLITFIPFAIGMFFIVGIFSSAAVGAADVNRPINPGVIAIQVSSLVLVTFCLFCFVRIGLKLPAVVQGRGDYGFFSGWTDTQGQAWQLIAIIAPLSIAYVVLSLVIGSALLPTLGSIGPAAAITASVLLGKVLQMIMLFVGITLLSWLYAFLVEEQKL